LAALALLGAAALVLSLLGAHGHRVEMERYRRALSDEAGIVVTSAQRTRRGYRLTGLRDPLAPDPAVVLARRGLRPALLTFTPFESLAPRIVEARARRTLRPPPEVSLGMADGTLRLAGEAPAEWIDRAILLAPALSGVQAVDATELRATDKLVVLRSAMFALESHDLRFAPGSARTPAPPDLARAADELRRVQTLARALNLDVCVRVVGHTDTSGGRERNAFLAEERAATVVRALAARGISGLRAESGGTQGRSPAARSVHFRVDLGCVGGS
jgi:hypothetical protein